MENKLKATITFTDNAYEEDIAKFKEGILDRLSDLKDELNMYSAEYASDIYQDDVNYVEGILINA